MKEDRGIFDLCRIDIDRIIGLAAVPLGLALVLVPFSLLIAWNILSLFLFWFVIVPGLSIYLPRFVSGTINHLFESLVGLIIFYGLMVLMIYDHFQTDYYLVMVLSLIVNFIVVSAITLTKKVRRIA